MKKAFALFLSLLILMGIPSAFALEISDDDFDYWYDQLVYLTEEIGVRRVGTEGEQTACEYLRGVFEDFGFSEEDGTLYEVYASVPKLEVYDNVSLVAVKPAQNENPDILTLCAHYDSVYEGARDNASGVAALLMMMRIFAAQEPLPDTELRFIAFSAEETGHQGSAAYCDLLLQDEIDRSIGVFNVDIITVDAWEELCFSIDTMGMRTEDGYVSGTPDAPAYNRVALAVLEAMQESGYYDEDDLNVTWCLPRHRGESDHESFHGIGIDSANICFHYPVPENGWPQLMHTPEDVIGDFDLERTRQALDVLYTAWQGFALHP